MESPLDRHSTTTCTFRVSGPSKQYHLPICYRLPLFLEGYHGTGTTIDEEQTDKEPISQTVRHILSDGTRRQENQIRTRFHPLRGSRQESGAADPISVSVSNLVTHVSTAEKTADV